MVQTQVYAPNPPRFSMVGKLLTPTLHKVDESISKGLAARLHRYAAKLLFEEGFGPLASDAKVTVYTIDGDDSPADRSYCVRWHTPQGGYVELVGILTRSGWPAINHGFCIGYEAHRDE